MVKIIVRAFGYAPSVPDQPTFIDVPLTHPFYSYIETAAANGIVSGYADHTFRPDANVTRGQLAKIDVKAAGWHPAVPTTPTFQDVAWKMPSTASSRRSADGVVSGYTCGAPGEPCGGAPGAPHPPALARTPPARRSPRSSTYWSCPRGRAQWNA